MKTSEILARIVTTLRAGKTIRIPDAPGARGMSWGESFHVGRLRPDDQPSVIHTIHMTRRDGKTTETPRECFWSIADIAKVSVDWEPEVIATLDIADPEDCAVRALIAAGQGTNALIAGRMMINEDVPGDDPAGSFTLEEWSLDHLVTVTPRG